MYRKNATKHKKSNKNGDNAGFYNFPDFHSSNGSGDGYTTYYRISNDTRDVLVVQSNYPVKDYFKVREICNDLMENLIKSPS